MRLEAMQLYVSMVDLKSITKAGRKYSMPQQSASSILSSLESELGAKLFKRERRGIDVTQEGMIFYEYCVNFMRDYIQLQRKFHPHDRKRKNYRVVTQNNIAQTIVPRWLSNILKQFPEVDIDITVGCAEEAISEVISGNSNVGLILLFEKDGYVYPSLPEEVEFHQIFYSNPFFWMNKKHPLANNKSISVKSIESYSVLQDQRSDLSLFEQIFQEYFGLNLNLIKAGNAQIMAQLVKENIAICPDLKPQYGQLALHELFENDENVVAKPISKKDTYKQVTGYIIRKEAIRDYELEKILDYLN